MALFTKQQNRLDDMHLEPRESKLAEADWYYAELDTAQGPGLLSRLRRGGKDNRVQGPVTLAQLQQLASSGRVDRQRTMVWRPHWQRWQAAGDVQTLFAHQCPPPLPHQPFRRGWVFRAVETSIFAILSLAFSIPLAILSGLVKAFGFVQQRIGLLLGSEGDEELGLAPATRPARSRFLARLGIMTMMSQAMVCAMGIGLIFAEFEEDMLPAYAFFWVLNLVIWSWFLYRAWAQVPAKFQPTDNRTMLYWLLVPGLSTYGWLRLLPELGDAAYRLHHGGHGMPRLPYQVSWWATVLCFIPGLNILGGLLLMIWLTGLQRDLRAIPEGDASPAWN